MTSKKDYYQSKKHVMEYIDMAEGYDGKELIEILKKHLPQGSTVLELGMGPGKDLDILKKDFDATGSDNSDLFLDMYREKHPNADLIHLDAQKLVTNRKFDCIYSNKVLHHLSTKKLKKSIKKQKSLLNNEGLLLHSFWHGDKEEIYKGLRFVYYTKEELINYFSEDFEIIEIETYKEMEDNDSVYVIVKSN
ncbi:MAG: methyltransferase domain-containing protein [Chloroflexia bacterium]|nr:methyltransferase domain-containing protein [Chloroflexia bacterium]